MIKPLNNKRTFEGVSDRLKELIFDGTFKPGQSLPSEHALAQSFQVGRQSIREALRVLEISGFITVRPGTGGGSVIEGTMLSKMAGMFLDTFKLHKVSLMDCMAARKIIEVSILDLVLENFDESDIEKLRENIRCARAHLSSGESTFEDNIEFHRILARSSKNDTFCIVIEALLAVYAEVRSKMTVTSKIINKKVLRIIDNHERLVEAIEARQNQVAIELLRDDLSFSEELVLSSAK